MNPSGVPIELVLVEDSEDDAAILLHELKRGGYQPRCRRVESGKALLEALAQRKPDIVISDYNLPGFGGLEALSIVRSLDPNLPFILMTGTAEQEAVGAMKTGAQDYVLKGQTARLLPILARELAEADKRRKAAEALHSREQQLLQAQKMEAVGQLAGGLAHDFNNLLGVILLHTESILDRPGDRDQVHAAATAIQKAQECASALVKQLLAFGRRQASEPRIYQLNALLEDNRKIIAVALGAKHELTYELAPSLPNVRIDPVQIEQVLMNLIVNARDAFGDRSGRVIVRTCEDADKVSFSVTDNGCGMERATQARVFEPFFTTKGIGKGTGLGLSMVFGIIQQHHGEIALESEVGKGTTFHLRFPPTSELSESQLSELTEASTGARILLVDDDDALRSALEANLKSRGYSLLVARSSTEALALGEDTLKRLDLMITDVHMPQIDGRELARRVHAMNSKIKVLFISGNSGDPGSKTGIDENSKSFLAKPFSGEALRKRIEDLL